MYRMILISDTHAGYKYGLVPPKWQLTSGVDATTKFQSYMWDCWEHFVKNCPRAEVLVVNGDAIHGEDHKDKALNIVSSDLFDQAQMFCELVEPLRKKAERMWILRGTAYHEGIGAQAIEWIARQLDAEKWKPGNRQSGYSLNLRWHGFTFDFAHHQTRGWIYPAGGGDRTALMQAAAEQQGKAPFADVLVRSHLHMKRIVRARGKWFIGTPGWTLVSPYAEKVMERSRALESSDIGGLVLSTEGKDDLGFREFDYEPFTEIVRDA